MQTESGKTLASILGLALVAAVLVMLMALLPRPNQPHQGGTYQAPSQAGQMPIAASQGSPANGVTENANTSERQKPETAYFGGWVTKDNAPDWIMAFITFAGIGIAIWQISEAKKAVLLTERADVFIESIGSVGGAVINPLAVLEITLKNYGATRADELCFAITQGMTDSKKVRAEDETPPTTVLGAGATISPRFAPLRDCLTKEAYAAVIAGTATFGLRGTVTYNDVFGKGHTLRCEAVYSINPQGFRIVENSSD